jgi:DNA-binding HxlR family transcriptional regulator
VLTSFIVLIEDSGNRLGRVAPIYAVPVKHAAATAGDATVAPSHAATPSAIGAGLLMLGDQWNLLILQQAFLHRVRRFADWHQALGLSESVLSGRLKELVEAGLLEGVPYKEKGRSRIEYLLTDKALELWSFLTAIWAWERAWIVIPAWPTQLVHLSCGANTDPELGCAACADAPVTARGTSVQSGPDTTFRNVAVPRHHRRTVRDREPAKPDSYRMDTLEILGDRWSTVLLVAAFLRVRRFADFANELGIAPGILSDRLRRFIELDVLTQRGTEYRLTPKGLGFFPVFAFLVDWAQRWYPHPEGGGLTITHEACGQPLRPYLRCSRCAAPLHRADVHFSTN